MKAYKAGAHGVLRVSAYGWETTGELWCLGLTLYVLGRIVIALLSLLGLLACLRFS